MSQQESEALDVDASLVITEGESSIKAGGKPKAGVEPGNVQTEKAGT